MIKATPAVERFWKKVYIGKYGCLCWTWCAYITPGGYGQFGLRKGKNVPAHRFAYEQIVGPIPEGLQLDHLCRVRSCVNPKHLEPVTQRENILRGIGLPAKEVLRTHCPKGHEYTNENTYLYRNCRQCSQCRKVHRDAHNLRAKLSRWAAKRDAR